jgi:hypothetical protein
MNRFLCALPLILFASLAAADSPRRLTTAEQADYLHRNLGLITSVVSNSLAQARDDAPLDRADACGKTAADLVLEIRQATDAHDSARAAELAHHLRRLLTQGVAANLSAARAAMPSGSAGEERLQKIQQRTINELRSLEEHLPAASTDDDMDRTIQAVRDGREKVEKAVTWPKKETEK